MQCFCLQLSLTCAKLPYLILELILAPSIATPPDRVKSKISQSLSYAIFPQPEVGHWPLDIGGTVGPSQQQLGFLFSEKHVAFMYAYMYRQSERFKEHLVCTSY